HRGESEYRSTEGGNMSYKAKVFSLLLVTTVFSVSLPAQEPGEHSWENLQQVRVGQRIEVVDTNLKKLKGTFLSFSEEAISLRVKKDEVGVPRVNVLRVSSLDRSKRKRNILLGLAIGAGGGMLAGAGVASAAVGFDEGQGSNPAATIVGFLAAGADAGVAVGASSGYRTIYRVKRKKPAKVRYRTITPKPASKETSAPEKKEI
ncbi:MAG: hypothetical protein V3R60_06785, partial [Acidobacteriota bacterium]